MNVVSSGTPRWKPAFDLHPAAYLVGLLEILPWRKIVDRHYAYGALDQSVGSLSVRVRPSFDGSWGCFDYCRPYKEEAEGGRILSAFYPELMYVDVVPSEERETVQRLATFLGHKYVAVPVGSCLAVLSTGPLGRHSVEVVDVEHFVTAAVMKVRWFGRISSTRGFLSPARNTQAWEGYHADTGRRCSHIHESREDAEACAIDSGQALDGSSAGWYVRPSSGWTNLGIVRLTTLPELAASARDCGLDVILHDNGDDPSDAELRIRSVEYDDPRFVRFREENHWKPPPSATNGQPPASHPQAWSIDIRGRVTGS